MRAVSHFITLEPTIFSDILAPTDFEATDACFSTMDHEASDQDERNPALHDQHGANDLPALPERL